MTETYTAVLSVHGIGHLPRDVDIERATPFYSNSQA